MNPKRTPGAIGQRRDVLLYLLFVLVTSFFTYFYRYNAPKAVYWDEPYHIAAAQKYLSGVYFMEQHPPLGKELLALGEYLVDANPKDDQFVKQDYAQGFDQSFSFAGYRLFPSLLAWLTAPILFLIFFYFTKNPAIAALLSFVYIFDNAQIMHNRGAMVDSPLTFFGMLQILAFLHVQDRSNKNIRTFVLWSLLFGVTFGLAVCTKAVGLIFILLVPAALLRLYPDWRKIVVFALTSFFGFLMAFVMVWHTHFALGDTVLPELNSGGYYQASTEYKAILEQKKNGSILAFPVMMRDSLKYITFYNKGVPRLDLCKPDENGSPAYFWPFGGRSINYRWEKTSENTYRYLYLQSNPVGWMCGFLGVVLAAFFLLSRILLPSREKLKHGFHLLLFFGLYCSYMAAISQLDRVMYLYHYFLPLLFSYILFGLVVDTVSQVGTYQLTENRKVVLLTILGLLIFAAFQFYRPLTYYEPITDAAFKRRALLPLWELTCVQCEKKSSLVVPRSEK